MASRKLPESKTWQFPQSHSCVVWKREKGLGGKTYFSLYVQSIDQYRFQREYSLKYSHVPGDSATLRWWSHVYMHPGRRQESEVSAERAKGFILRFLYLCDHYPSLLFNAAGDHAADASRPRSEGFVHLCERLHRGETVSKRLLD